MLKQRRLICPEFREFRSYIESIKDEIEEADYQAFSEWLSLKENSWFQGKGVDEILEWAADNLIKDLRELKAEQSWRNAAAATSGIGEISVSESGLEDAMNWVEATQFTGSPKQIRWAKSLAMRNLRSIITLWKQDKKVSTSSRWWIDNYA